MPFFWREALIYFPQKKTKQKTTTKTIAILCNGDFYNLNGSGYIQKYFSLLFNKFYKKNIIIYIITIVFAILYIAVGSHIANKDKPEFTNYYEQMNVQAVVKEITNVESEHIILGETDLEIKTIYFKAELTEKPHKGVVVDAVHIDDPTNPYKLKPLELGDNIFLLYANNPDSDISWTMQEYRRVDTIIIFAVIIGIVTLFLGKSKGVSTLVSLGFTCLAIFTVFIPAILSGKNIYICTIITGIFIILITVILINSIDRKSICAMIGCFAGFLTSGLLVVLMDSFLKLSGYLDEDSIYLTFINTAKPIDLKAIIFASIVIGALGAVLDVAISIASSLNEIYEAGGFKSRPGLLKSGLNIGRDMIGTMANTLILAYIGGSMNTVILLLAYNDSLDIIFNKEFIIVEMLQSLTGIAAIILTIPLTAIACSYIFTKKEEDSLENSN